MTNPGEMTDTIDVHAIKHICLVGNNRAPVQGTARRTSRCSVPTNLNAMPATSCCARWAAPARMR
ncbi:hypothetical protein CO675_07115 [Bradyrhizobium sp. C9]|nr:hypothetical protein CO675_07115 [Bradyrhizobium sp. C9]